MPDEQTQTAENVQPEQEPTVEPTPVQEQEPVAPAEPAEEAPQVEAKPTRAQRRISDLTGKLKEAQQREAQLQALTDSQNILGAQQGQDPWQAYDNGEITMDQLKSVVQNESRSSATFAAQVEAQKLRQELAEKEFWGGFESDVHALEAQNPRFNPSSPEFDQQYVEELSQLYLEAYGNDPQRLMKAPKLSQFVSKIDRMRSRAEAEGQSRSSAQLAEQAAQGAVVGTGAPVSNKGNSREALKQQALQTRNFKDYYKSLAEE